MSVERLIVLCEFDILITNICMLFAIWEGGRKMVDMTDNKEQNRVYIAIDLKSFFASVECVERGLDPLTTNLVVADASRTEKTICLAVTP